MKLKLILAITFFGSILFAVQACAEEGKAYERLNSGSKDSNKGLLVSSEFKEPFTTKKRIDGYSVSFRVVPVKERTHDQRSLSAPGESEGNWKHMLNPSHRFMVKIEKNGRAITDVIINARVIHPMNGSESKILTRAGDWYKADYNLGHDGRHNIIILFKTADGAKHRGSVYYQENKERS